MTPDSARLSSPHSHRFLGDDHARNERRTWLVIGLTAAMMVIEIVAGTIFGSMALVADGWHMSTHAAALLIAALAYLYARRNANNPRFTFGTGKLGDLAGFASAIILVMVALFIGWESVLRFQNPVAIDFPQAITVAVIGLAVNLFCAYLLRDDHSHHGHAHHDHHHEHEHEHEHEHHAHPHASHNTKTHADHNLRAAYLHVLADALTSVLAIVALLFGSLYGWNWMDPAMGIIGAVIITRWSWSLIRHTGGVLVDYLPRSENLPDEIRSAIEKDGDAITDLHVWRLGPGHHGAILSIRTASERSTAFYREKLAHIHDLSHLTVEIETAV